MMWLEFVVFGSWFATLGLVLAQNGLPTIIGIAYSLAAVAAIIAPMFLGAVGDRFLASQKVLGLAHIVGGVLMLFLPTTVRLGNARLTLLLILAYMLCFMPTLGLANSIAFRHLESNQNRFPYVRVFGTVGWVVAGVLVGALGLSASASIFYVTAVASFAFAGYAFTLPETPPPAKGVRFSFGDVIGAGAWPLLRDRNFAVFMICAILTSIALGVYNTFSSPYLGALGISNVAGVLALGQFSEVIFVVTIPLALRSIGMKWSLLLGMCMWAIRFALFIAAAGGSAWLVVVSIGLQGVCNDFFLVLGAMYIDRVAPKEVNAQAQSMLILVVSGIGALIGSMASGYIYGATVALNPATGPAAWIPIWLLPIGTALAVAVIWIVFFRDSRGDRRIDIETQRHAMQQREANILLTPTSYPRDSK